MFNVQVCAAEDRQDSGGDVAGPDRRAARWRRALPLMGALLLGGSLPGSPLLAQSAPGAEAALTQSPPAVAPAPSTLPVPAGDPASAALKAEAEARAAFESNHYYFVTDEGTVDPATGGLPPNAVGLRSWSAYRGAVQLTEVEILRLVGQQERIRGVRLRRASGIGLSVLGVGLGAVSTVTTSIAEDSVGRIVLGGLGVFGGFGMAMAGKGIAERRDLTLDELFAPMQRLNDELRQNYRAQYRLMYGVPLDPPVLPENSGR